MNLLWRRRRKKNKQNRQNKLKTNQKIIKTKSYIQKTIFQFINPNHEQIIIKILRKRKIL